MSVSQEQESRIFFFSFSKAEFKQRDSLVIIFLFLYGVTGVAGMSQDFNTLFFNTSKARLNVTHNRGEEGEGTAIVPVPAKIKEYPRDQFSQPRFTFKFSLRCWCICRRLD